MIITKKYESFSLIRSTVIGNQILHFLFSRIEKRIKKLVKEKGSQHILSGSHITALLSDENHTESYDNLYNTYYSVMDEDEVSTLIDGFLTEFKNDGVYTNFELLRTYLFAFFIGGWSQLVEHTYKYRTESGDISYIGAKSDSEYKVIESIQNTFNHTAFSVSVISILSDRILEMMGKLFIFLKKRKEIDPKRLLASYPEEKKTSIIENTKRSIVINILEERRFARIAELHRELIDLGYSVILYSALPKVETLRGIKKHPQLADCMLLDSHLISKKEAADILMRSKNDIEKAFKNIRNSPHLNKFKYRGVPLAEIAIDDIYVVLMHRGMQAALNQHVIQQCIKKYNVCGFIGMDNSVATSVWLDECAKHKIPSFFHFYNATLSPILYRMLLDSYNPTAWILGGSGQLKYFREGDHKKKDNFIVCGDMFADTIVRCDKETLRKKMKDLKSIPDDKKVAILISCYVIADFTEERKKIFFQTVASAVEGLGMELVIKAHPNEELSILEKQMKEWNVKAAIFHTEDIRDVFLAGDVVCMYNSEAAQQAMLVGVPVISLVSEEMVPVFDKNWNYYSSGAIEFVPLGDDPSETISKVVSDSNFRKALIDRAKRYTEKLLGKSDGNNAKRFAETVHSYILNN